MKLGLYGPDRAEITDRASWEEHAPASLAHADAWLDGVPAAVAALGDFDAVNARPAHRTQLASGATFTHGVFACLKRNGATVLVVSVGDDSDAAREAVRIEAEARGVTGSAVLAGYEPPAP